MKKFKETTPDKTEIQNQRIHSLDALRGFDMFFIMGGDYIFIALGTLTGWPILKWWAAQMQHASWHGFTCMDLVFPLFLFIAGVSFPFSYSKHYQGVGKRKSLYIHLLKRGFTLLILGVIYNNWIRFDLEHLRYGSVLGHIGLAWMFAAIIFVNSTFNFRIVWLVGLLIFYWLLLTYFPAHDLGISDPFSMNGSLTGYIDRLIMPGKLLNKTFESEGFLNLIPAIASALLGMLIGQFISIPTLSQLRKVIYIVIIGVTLIIIGLLWNTIFPINKQLWTSSFVCFSGGISVLLFALFYWIIDVLNFRKWATFFVVIGLNSITIYLAQQIIDFKHTSTFFFGGIVALIPTEWTSFISSIAYTTTCWFFLYFLYKKKIFLKV